MVFDMSERPDDPSRASFWPQEPMPTVLELLPQRAPAEPEQPQQPSEDRDKGPHRRRRASSKYHAVPDDEQVRHKMWWLRSMPAARPIHADSLAKNLREMSSDRRVYCVPYSPCLRAQLWSSCSIPSRQRTFVGTRPRAELGCRHLATRSNHQWWA
jgi:hypothetical protein